MYKLPGSNWRRLLRWSHRWQGLRWKASPSGRHIARGSFQLRWRWRWKSSGFVAFAAPETGLASAGPRWGDERSPGERSLDGRDQIAFHAVLGNVPGTFGHA